MKKNLFDEISFQKTCFCKEISDLLKGVDGEKCVFSQCLESSISTELAYFKLSRAHRTLSLDTKAMN